MGGKRAREKPKRFLPRQRQSGPEDEVTFSEIVRLITNSREKALQAVNTALIELYWQVGEIISRKVESAERGEGIVDRLAEYLAKAEPGLRGFTRRNLFRMKQFYEAYKEDAKVSPLVAQLPWSYHLIILGQSKRPRSGTSTSSWQSGNAGANVSWNASSWQLSLSVPYCIRHK